MQKLTIILLCMCSVLSLKAQKKIVSKKIIKTIKTQKSVYPKGIISVGVQYNDYRLNHIPNQTCLPTIESDYPDFRLIVLLRFDQKIFNSDSCAVKIDSVKINFKDDILSGIFTSSFLVKDGGLQKIFYFETPFKLPLKYDSNQPSVKIHFRINEKKYIINQKYLTYYHRKKNETYTLVDCE